jgi:hypothetical protein
LIRYTSFCPFQSASVPSLCQVCPEVLRSPRSHQLEETMGPSTGRSPVETCETARLGREGPRVGQWFSMSKGDQIQWLVKKNDLVQLSHDAFFGTYTTRAVRKPQCLWDSLCQRSVSLLQQVPVALTEAVAEKEQEILQVRRPLCVA